MTGDVRALHGAPEHANALFQVASQFNLLEMVGPEVTPEDGVTRYQGDKTQGPACAIAAGAATIYVDVDATGANVVVLGAKMSGFDSETMVEDIQNEISQAAKG